MRNRFNKYQIENLGSFVELDDKDFNELCSLELNLSPVTGILYLKQDYQYTGNEILLSHSEFKAILKSSISDSSN